MWAAHTRTLNMLCTPPPPPPPPGEAPKVQLNFQHGPPVLRICILRVHFTWSTIIDSNHFDTKQSGSNNGEFNCRCYHFETSNFITMQQVAVDEMKQRICSWNHRTRRWAMQSLGFAQTESEVLEARPLTQKPKQRALTDFQVIMKSVCLWTTHRREENINRYHSSLLGHLGFVKIKGQV